ncbi:type 2 ribosome-inactivating protein cinnamomin III precursor [Cinnamomum micranthum f. kanehirae]|uniref:Ribosome-inactivating protein n=1 Tax=Cinnamomum micranthum f. kanehirae TaxID=337451 RepID=A0A443PL07_9MAGN|nr:type 2 ribosome-inactivating protein cinnamomin III precursor [Cinnamomum micranthum f. kanehirae]
MSPMLMWWLIGLEVGPSSYVWIVVATWVWWNAVVGPTWVCPFMVVEPHTLNYQTVTFTTKNATKTSYTQFIEALRAQLASGEEPHGIPVMRERSTVPDSRRFILVELSNWAADSPVTLAVDVTNAYVVAYRTGSQSFFLREDNPDPAIENLLPDTQRYTFPFSGSYTDLERVAGERREEIQLGMDPLENAISALWISNLNQQRALARSLIVVIQMVPEAVRYRFIEYRVRESITRAEMFRPDPAMLSLENNWSALSNAVQQSNQGGVFSSPVELRSTSNKPVYVGSVSDRVISGLAIMLFICRSSDRASSDQFIDHLLMIRPTLVDVADVATDADNDDTCADPEPTVRISGRNGLCVDVRDGKYNNGNPIQLWPCQQNSDVKQLWTLRRDGTIRSNGKCLTTNGYSAGDYVMIYDCSTPVTAAGIWQLWANGTIINPQSALALSAESGNSGTTLTVQANIYASRQGWLAGNNTEPFVTSIVGFNDLCMQANGDAMWVVECESSKAEQEWALYPDGSIRPDQDRDRCLTSTDNDSQGSIIIISSCSPGSEGQRWVFMNDGTILNLNNGLVMEVKGSDPSLHQIIIWPATGKPNQQWLPLL